MIKYLKLGSNRIIVKCILGVVILSLVLGTINIYQNKDTEKYAATVNGEKISVKMLNNMYFLEREKQRKILGKYFVKIKKNKNFINDTYNYVLSQLIDNALLEQYAKKMHFQVNNDQAKKIILNAPLFQRNHQFNQKKYFNYLISMKLTNHEYINIIKKKLNTEKLIQSLSNTDFILNEEKKHIMNLLSEKRVIKKTVLDIRPIMKKQNISNLEAYQYFSKHKNNFYIPEKFKIHFIKLEPSMFKIKCNDKEIYEWYKKNINKYFTKEKRRYSIIQTKTKDEALSILSELHVEPKNFSKIAKEKSIDPISSKNGGDIGWMSIDMIPDIIKQANLHHPHQISNIMSFKNNFLIITLNDIAVKHKKKISEVSGIIRKQIKYKKSLKLYHKLKYKILNTIKNNTDQFDVILKKMHLSPKKTDWFDKNSIPHILKNPILKNNIFNNESFKKDPNFKFRSHFIHLKNHQSFLVNISDYQSKKIKKFESVKDQIIYFLTQKKSIKILKKKSEYILTQLQKGNQTLLRKLNLYFSDAQNVSRYDNNPIVPIIFNLPYPKNHKKIYTSYEDANKNIVIISLEKICHEDFSSKEKKIIIKYLEKNNIETILHSLINSLREKSDIKYEKIQ